MKAVFLDTNFLMDLFIRAEYRDVSERLIDKCIDCNINYYVSFLSVANFAYIMRKAPYELLKRYIDEICSQFNVLTNDVTQLQKALKLEANDYEDGVQYITALSGKCECIITRDKKHFNYSRLPVYTPQEFLSLTE